MGDPREEASVESDEFHSGLLDMPRWRGPWDTGRTLSRYEERDLSQTCRSGGHQGRGGD